MSIELTNYYLDAFIRFSVRFYDILSIILRDFFPGAREIPGVFCYIFVPLFLGLLYFLS